MSSLVTLWSHHFVIDSNPFRMVYQCHVVKPLFRYKLTIAAFKEGGRSDFSDFWPGKVEQSFALGCPSCDFSLLVFISFVNAFKCNHAGHTVYEWHCLDQAALPCQMWSTGAHLPTPRSSQSNALPMFSTALNRQPRWPLTSPPSILMESQCCSLRWAVPANMRTTAR